MELLAAGRARAEPAKRRDRAHIGAGARQGPQSSRRDPLLYPCRGSLGPPCPRRTLRRPVARRRSWRRPPRSHAEPHLLPGRALPRRAGGQHDRGRGGREVPGGERRPDGGDRLGSYPHNVHFVMASALMAGDGPNSIAAADKLHGLIPDAAALAIPGAQPVKAAPYYAHALFSSPDAILALPDPGNSIPYVKAMWH